MNATASTAIVPRQTIVEIVANRDRVLSLYDAALSSMSTTADAFAAAHAAGKRTRPAVNRFSYSNDNARKHFQRELAMPDREQFRLEARRVIDTDTWAHIIEITDLERLMDKEAKDKLGQQLIADPPEVTVENVQATLQQLYLDAGTIFRRGIANCFSSLDRRFRSHDGWKIGSRVILTYALSEWGSWNYNSNRRDTIRDIERTFLVLDGKPMPPDYFGLAAAIERDRGGRSGRRQGYTETEYFRVRTFMNGNAHVWFKRDDLLERVNQLLGEFYGAPIPEERKAKADPLAEIKHTPAKRFGFFPTPPAAVDFVMNHVSLGRRDGEPRLRVLEPSAGTGNVARPCRKAGTVVDCVEIQPDLARQLAADGFRTINADFLALTPNVTGLYDRIIMNPPFDRERDIDHVVHALKFLKPDGYLIAIMSAGTEFRETRKSQAFRELVESKKGRFRDLPAGSFSEVGTNVNTVILTMWNDGTRSHW